MMTPQSLWNVAELVTFLMSCVSARLTFLYSQVQEYGARRLSKLENGCRVAQIELLQNSISFAFSQPVQTRCINSIRP
jgi:hypothetical protein